ncbi:MAG: manganese efflux pump MntP family protein [Thermodesulfobacteriota bacterium]|nr:manganese efflux pump MntP family protein [Thermodesulfobacteriota bacterium]
MNHFTLLLIAFGLAMDAFAVSISNGITIKSQRTNHALRIGLFFGSFQALMPLVGWSAGLNLRDFISGVDHWIAFGLLSLIGCKMIYESKKTETPRKEVNSLSLWMLLALSIATSIDALAVGISFAFLNISIATPIIVIGSVTFVLSFLGVLIGNRIGHLFAKKIEFLGGLILIGIGIKILIEHSFPSLS